MYYQCSLCYDITTIYFKIIICQWMNIEVFFHNGLTSLGTPVLNMIHIDEGEDLNHLLACVWLSFLGLLTCLFPY